MAHCLLFCQVLLLFAGLLAVLYERKLVGVAVSCATAGVLVLLPRQARSLSQEIHPVLDDDDGVGGWMDIL